MTTIENMDDIFKFTYEVFVFANVHMIEPEWDMQVLRLHEIWEDLRAYFNEYSFVNLFSSHCAELDLPAETYNLKKGFEMATHEWRNELIINVADRIIKSFNDDVSLSSTPVSWDKHKKCLIVDKTICNAFNDDQ